jgi:peptide/nickel transport system ATP-binding protein
MIAAPALLELSAISKRYDGGRAGTFGLGARRKVQALSDVTLTIRHGEVVGLVGESGSGKSTLGRIAVGLERPTSGEVLYEGAPVTVPRSRRARARLLDLQMIFQNAVAALNPRQRVRDIIAEPLRVHRRGEGVEAVAALLEQVGLPTRFMSRYPHELSGGQCQRVGIARALTVSPKLLVCDEPVSALDVSIQAQILNLFADLRERGGFSYLFISHDLHVVERLSDRVAVMYLGEIVECGPTAQVYEQPAHPYTKALMAAAPRIGGGRRRAKPIEGEIPSPFAPPSGCRFHPRCPFAMPVCRQIAPQEVRVGPGHSSRCHLNAATPPAA